MKHIFIFLTLLIFSCNSPNAPEISILSGENSIMQKGESLHPLAIGNLWEYEYKQYNNEDLVTSEGERKHEIINLNNNIYELRVIGIDRKTNISTTSYYYNNDKDGFYIYGYKNDYDVMFKQKQKLLKYPIEAGEEWNYESEDSTIVSLVCESIDDVYNLNGKEYKSVRIKATVNGFVSNINNYIRGIGLVHNRTFCKLNGKTYKHEYKLIHNIIN